MSLYFSRLLDSQPTPTVATFLSYVTKWTVASRNLKTMKISLLLASFVTGTSAFAPVQKSQKTTTQLNLNRRDFCATAAVGFVGFMPSVANAKPAVRNGL